MSNLKTALTYRKEFERFWKWSPPRGTPARKTEKEGAYREYQKLIKKGIDPVHLEGCLRKWHAETRGSDPQYIQSTRKWLHNGCWQDYSPKEIASEEDLFKKIIEPVQLRHTGLSLERIEQARRAQQAIIGLIGLPAYRTWFADLTLVEDDTQELCYRAPTRYHAQHVRAHYAHAIRIAWGESVEVVV